MGCEHQVRGEAGVGGCLWRGSTANRPRVGTQRRESVCAKALEVSRTPAGGGQAVPSPAVLSAGCRSLLVYNPCTSARGSAYSSQGLVEAPQRPAAVSPAAWGGWGRAGPRGTATGSALRPAAAGVTTSGYNLRAAGAPETGGYHERLGSSGHDLNGCRLPIHPPDGLGQQRQHGQRAAGARHPNVTLAIHTNKERW